LRRQVDRLEHLLDGVITAIARTGREPGDPDRPVLAPAIGPTAPRTPLAEYLLPFGDGAPAARWANGVSYLSLLLVLTLLTLAIKAW
jgi:hypothetical protein